MYRDSYHFPLLSSIGRMPSVRRGRPDAYAILRGSTAHPDLHGTVTFLQTPAGVLVTADVTGLPTSEEHCEMPVFGFHIHNGTGCEDQGEEPFPMSGTHYNPWSCPHPYHAGDLPPLFGVGGSAFLSFLTGRFAVRDVLGLPVIIHAEPDDFHTQPSGNSGMKIACGVILPTRR